MRGRRLIALLYGIVDRRQQQQPCHEREHRRLHIVARLSQRHVSQRGGCKRKERLARQRRPATRGGRGFFEIGSSGEAGRNVADHLACGKKKASWARIDLLSMTTKACPIANSIRDRADALRIDQRFFIAMAASCSALETDPSPLVSAFVNQAVFLAVNSACDS